MTGILHKTTDATAGGESKSGGESNSIKQRQNSEKARQNGTHPDTRQDKNKSKTVYTDNNGKALVKGSRSYPEDLMTSGNVGRRKRGIAKGVEQRRPQDNSFD
ncbi:hypothetical protein PEBR_01365 [Penicillium brasilianum]|uniref:Uncharacterized protein n=1 Tax=Penicillium brasilianum TaxID=104259 RepID=A0A1S9S081_PENBI|nr:hypothetical protein PEBR_01365 [Penicillium brasilianum]